MEVGTEALESTIRIEGLSPVDILDRQLKFHFTDRARLSSILVKGIYSPKFAERIGDKEFETHSLSEGDVFVLNDYTPFVISMAMADQLDLKDIVGIVVDVPQDFRVPLRIGPRQIIGLVVIDAFPKGADQSHLKQSLPSKKERSILIQEIEKIFKMNEEKVKPLPIYGVSGDMYWPKRMIHEEVVEVLKTKQR